MKLLTVRLVLPLRYLNLCHHIPQQVSQKLLVLLVILCLQGAQGGARVQAPRVLESTMEIHLQAACPLMLHRGGVPLMLHRGRVLKNIPLRKFRHSSESRSHLQ